MAEKKNEVAEQGSQQAQLVVNNTLIDGLAKQLEQKKQVGLAFPPDYNVANALNSAYLILKDADKNPLQTCTQQSIASCLMDMAVQALNPMKKQCYFVPYGKKLTLMRSYQGTMAVAKRVGAKKIVAECIYADDDFQYHIENGIKVIDKHTQIFQNIDNDKIVGAYAVVSMDDYQYVEIMNMAQIEKAWKKGYGYKKGQGVHEDFKDQMAKKTVISRACKNFINSSDDAYLQEAYDNTTENEDLDYTKGNAEYEIEQNANSVDFEDVSEPEVVIEQAEEQPQAEQAEPDWMG